MVVPPLHPEPDQARQAWSQMEPRITGLSTNVFSRASDAVASRARAPHSCQSSHALRTILSTVELHRHQSAVLGQHVQ